MLSSSRASKPFDSKLIGLLLENSASGVHQYRRSGLLQLDGIDKEALLSCSGGLVPLDSGHSNKRGYFSSLHHRYCVNTSIRWNPG